MCSCILCRRPVENCSQPRVCDLHDLDNLTEREATDLNLFYGGRFYQPKEEVKDE